jgi:hypothetical protein
MNKPAQRTMASSALHFVESSDGAKRKHMQGNRVTYEHFYVWLRSSNTHATQKQLRQHYSRYLELEPTKH